MNIIIIPAYKPSMIVIDIVRNICKEGYQAIVVDDGSGEMYAPVFEKIKAIGGIVLTHDSNQGKGNAIKTALQYTMAHFNEEDIIATMDADGQHALKDVFHVVKKAQENRKSLILGVRDFSGKIPYRSKFGNKITKEVFYLGNKVKISDTQTGLRAFSYAMISVFCKITGNRYEYEMNVLSYCAENRIEILEVPIQTIYLDAKNSASHFRVLKDSILIYKDILKFTFSSAMSFLVDYFCFFIFFLVLQKIRHGILISNILARLLSAGFNYTLNANFVFRAEKRSIRSMLQYAALAIAILSMNNVILLGAINFFQIPPMASKIITELVLFILSFFIQHLFIFKKQKS